jgi:CheY-like chemotaxis protein
VARTGEAVDICRNNPDIDLILMDMQMPGWMDMKQPSKFENLIKPSSSHSQLLDYLTTEKSIAAGCSDYISKPINKSELLALIYKYFNK